MEELSGQRIAMGFFQSHVYEVRSSFVNHIVIAYHLSAFLLLGNYKVVLSELAAPEVVTDAYETFHNEIHLGHLLLFFVDDPILTDIIKFSGHEPNGEVRHEVFVLLNFISE
jgi:hypothetical protein